MLVEKASAQARDQWTHWQLAVAGPRGALLAAAEEEAGLCDFCTEEGGWAGAEVLGSGLR